MIANIFGGDGLIVLIIALVVLVGGSQLPKIARNVGLAGKEFRNAQAEAEADAAKKKAKTGVPEPLAVPQAAPAVPASSPEAVAEPAISLTPAQLDALLKAREEQVRKESANPAPS
jgi:Sec-independent protein translocase protein TatA